MAEEKKDAAESGDDGAAGSSSPGVEINQCPSCSRDIDISGLGPFSKIVCPHCEEAVRVRTRLGNYQILRLLGEGGMSQVFLAEDLALDRQVALKILHQDLSRDAALMALFEREAKLTASINHPNVVKVYTVGSGDGYFYIAMELVDNFSLEERITGDGFLREREALDLLHDVAAGLRTAFQGGLIHRDIKPGNILLTEEGSGKLVDFGLAVQQGGDDMVEDLWATPFYVPPEKLEGEPDDLRGDIYSLGATFFHVLAGSPPFDANTASLDELREIKGKPVSLTHTDAMVSIPTVKLIDRMMAYQPDARPQSYDELLAAIEEAQARLPGGSKSRVQRQKALAPQKQGLSVSAWIGIGGGILAVIAIAIVVIVGSGNGGDDLPEGFGEGGGDRVLSPGERAVAGRYLEARKQLAAGKSSIAARAFDDLLKSGDLKQPILGWARFNFGLAALMNGESPEKVRGTFEELLREAPPEVEGEASPLAREAAFFRKAGQLLVDPLPVMPPAVGEFDPNSIEALGIFASALKNWNHQEFESALIYLDAFERAPLAPGIDWVGDYQSLAETYRTDAAKLEELPRPSIQMSEAELETVRTRLEETVTELKTKGGARDLVQGRIGRIDDLLKAKKALASAPPISKPSKPESGEVAMTPPPVSVPGPPVQSTEEPTAIEWTPEAEIEKAQFAAAIETMVPVMNNYRFAEVRDLAAGFASRSPAMKQLQEDYLVAMDRAAEFKARLVTHLAGGEYEGKLVRKEGVPLDCKIVGADPEKLVVDLMFGPNDLGWEAVAPAWMVETAVGAWLSESPGVENFEDWEQAVWFARQTGRREEAASLAGALSSLSDEFTERWKRLEPLP